MGRWRGDRFCRDQDTLSHIREDPKQGEPCRCGARATPDAIADGRRYGGGMTIRTGQQTLCTTTSRSCAAAINHGSWYFLDRQVTRTLQRRLARATQHGAGQRHLPANRATHCDRPVCEKNVSHFELLSTAFAACHCHSTTMVGADSAVPTSGRCVGTTTSRGGPFDSAAPEVLPRQARAGPGKFWMRFDSTRVPPPAERPTVVMLKRPAGHDGDATMTGCHGRDAASASDLRERTAVE